MGPRAIGENLASGCATPAALATAANNAATSVLAELPRRHLSTHGVERPHAERCDLTARSRADVDPEIGDRANRIAKCGAAPEMRAAHRDHAGNVGGARVDHDALTFVELIPQR